MVVLFVVSLGRVVCFRCFGFAGWFCGVVLALLFAFSMMLWLGCLFWFCCLFGVSRFADFCCLTRALGCWLVCGFLISVCVEFCWLVFVVCCCGGLLAVLGCFLVI